MMRFEYRYVIAGETSFSEVRLNDLLKDGWSPLRETACPISGTVGGAAWLVLFEREIPTDEEESSEESYGTYA